MAEGEAALAMLSRHPATHRHLATKLARHFIADDPPRAVIDRLARVFRDSDGDLAAVARALVDTREAWREPLAEVKTPHDFVMSGLRALGSDGSALAPERFVRPLAYWARRPLPPRRPMVGPIQLRLG